MIVYSNKRLVIVNKNHAQLTTSCVVKDVSDIEWRNFILHYLH